MIKSHFKYIGIDPGAGGGIAVIDKEDSIKAYKCPQSSEDMALLFEVLIGDTPPENIRLLMERVWARPTNAVRAAFHMELIMVNGLVLHHHMKLR